MSKIPEKRVETKLEELMLVISERLETGGRVTFSPWGVSMLPLLAPGRDSVTLEKPNRTFLKNDMIFYRRANGQFVLHRIEKVKTDGMLVLRGDNQWYKESVNPINVLGIVVEFTRKGKVNKCRGFNYGFYVNVIRHIHRFGIFAKLAIGKIKRMIKIER